MRVVVVGGGPGGLSFAILAKARRPDLDIAVYERNRAEDTFGFGVVFSDATLDALADGDPEVHRTLTETAVKWREISVELRGDALRVGGNGFTAFGRRELLAVLQRRARELAIPVHYRSEIDDERALAVADLVVVADGVNSLVRQRRAAAFGSTIVTGRSKFIWFGTPRVYDCLSFAFERNEHGAFGLHAYVYNDELSTFLVETDEATWRAAGFDTGDEPALDPVAGDLAAKAYCERLFERTLAGHPLVGNGSRWTTFRTVRNARWSAGNMVLLGDAAHSAHFSVGSGTKMAMEDAIALAAAFAEHDRLDDAFAAYETARRPSVERIQRASLPSITWWESFRHYLDMPLEQFAFHFMTRSDRVTRSELLKRDPAFVARVDRWYATQPHADASAAVGRRVASLTVDDSPDAVDVVAVAATGSRLAREGYAAVLLHGSDTRDGRQRFALTADALRNGAGMPVFVDGAFDADFRQTLLVAGRADG